MQALKDFIYVLINGLMFSFFFICVYFFIDTFFFQYP